MYVYFEKDGVLTIEPEDHAEAMTLKWFLREFATHGNKMINVKTEYEDNQSYDQERERRNQEDQFQGEPYEERQNQYYEDSFGFVPQYPKYFEVYSERGRGGSSSNRGGNRGGRGRNR